MTHDSRRTRRTRTALDVALLSLLAALIAGTNGCYYRHGGPKRTEHADMSTTRASEDTTDPLIDASRREIIELHQFFDDWFVGRIEQTDEVFDRFAGVMAPDFTIVSPDGHLTERAPLVDRLWGAHGFQRGQDSTFGIRVEKVTVRPVGDGLYLATYEEWQKSGAGDRGRQSSTLLRRADDAPNGLEWLYVHETWLPDTPEHMRR